jgi:hypothetical protein
LPTVVQGLAEQGQFDVALQTAQSITDPTQKAEALIAIARVYSEPTTAKGDTRSWLTDWRNWFQSLLGDSKREKAQAVLDQALQIATTLDQRK